MAGEKIGSGLWEAFFAGDLDEQTESDSDKDQLTAAPCLRVKGLP